MTLSIGRILGSLALIVFVGAAAISATGAFFSDTETSTGNTFTAGDIDLQIDNESYAIDYNIPGFDDPDGSLVVNPANSWTMADLVAGVQKFFSFTDLKPGDMGEDTISIHVGSNNAWMCASARVTVDSDETCTEPEGTDENGNCVVEVDGTNGDLADQLNFAFWHDDGDNVLETNEVPSIFLSGPLGNIGTGGKITLADSNGGIMGADNPIPGDSTFYIGKAWCFGTLESAALAQDGQTNDGPVDDADIEGADRLGTGVTCDGSAADNTAQTDKVEGDMQFYAVQSRNNADFTCAEDYTPVWGDEQ